MLEHNSHNLVASVGMKWMNMVVGIKNNDWLPIKEKKLESQEQKRREKREEEEEEEIKRNARQKIDTHFKCARIGPIAHPFHTTKREMANIERKLSADNVEGRR